MCLLLGALVATESPAEKRSLAVDGAVPVPAAVTVPVPTEPPAPGRWGPRPAPVWPVAGGGAVSVASAPAGRARVVVLDRPAARRIGLAGTLFRVDAGRGPVGVVVDYGPFRYAFGGGYAARLSIRRLPVCVLDRPDDPACLRGVAVPSRNDHRAGRLYATVTPSADAVYAVAPEPEDETGQWKATPLSPAGKWDVSPASGDFRYSYDIRLPDPPGGAAPKLTLGYSSQSVDGRTVATNNQASPAGVGWDLPFGFVERRFTGCADDGWESRPELAGELCWHSDNAVISLEGRTAELIRVSGDEWRLTDDPGWRVQRLWGADNAARRGERWVVTTQQGTQYHFGLGREPYSNRETGSVFTVPVVGDDAGEPCHEVTRCAQAWRWNLDYVVDANENATTVLWRKDVNHYRHASDGQIVAYTRDGRPESIEYGRRRDRPADPAPARVLIASAYPATGRLRARNRSGRTRAGTRTSRWTCPAQRRPAGCSRPRSSPPAASRA